jgi:hypothetical protein
MFEYSYSNMFQENFFESIMILEVFFSSSCLQLSNTAILIIIEGHETAFNGL